MESFPPDDNTATRMLSFAPDVFLLTLPGIIMIERHPPRGAHAFGHIVERHTDAASAASDAPKPAGLRETLPSFEGIGKGHIVER